MTDETFKMDPSELRRWSLDKASFLLRDDPNPVNVIKAAEKIRVYVDTGDVALAMKAGA